MAILAKVTITTNNIITTTNRGRRLVTPTTISAKDFLQALGVTKTIKVKGITDNSYLLLAK